MKNIYNYRVYLIISLMSLFIGGLLNIFQDDARSEKIALIALFFFTIAVVIVAFEQLPFARPNIIKKIKSLLLIWKK